MRTVNTLMAAAILCSGLSAPALAHPGHGQRADRLEDVRDRHEDVRDRREDVRDAREDVRDAKRFTGIGDIIEDVLRRP